MDVYSYIMTLTKDASLSEELTQVLPCCAAVLNLFLQLQLAPVICHPRPVLSLSKHHPDKDASLSEELTQEVFYRAMRSEFQGRSSELTWLCAIAK